LVDWGKIDLHASADKFSMHRIDVINNEIHDASSHTIAAERRDDQPHPISRQAHVAGIAFNAVGPMGKPQLKAQALAVELFGCGRAGNVQ